MTRTQHPDLERPQEGPETRGGLLQRAHGVVVRIVEWWQRWQLRVPRLVALARVVYLPFALLLVAYIGYAAARDINVASIQLWPLVLAYVTAVAWWVALASGWSALITERFELGPVRAWCKTQVTRYLPGGIWAPLTRATTVQGRMRDKAAAVLAENVTVLSVALGVGALWVTVHNPLWLPLVVLTGLPLLGARWLERRTRVTRSGVAKATGCYAVGYVAYGVTGILTQVAVSGVRHPTYPLYVAGAACVAWAVGLVVVFAPGGVGVRELVYVWMLGGLYPHAELQAAAVTSRLVTVLAELTVLALVSLPVWRTAREGAVARPLDTLSAQTVSGKVGEG